MDKFKGKYRIDSNRAKFWDYSSPADYFITICIEERENILGHIENGNMILSEYGEIVELEIKKISGYHKRVIMDVWVIMPNHIHLILTLGDYNFDNGISSIGDVEEIHEFPLQLLQSPIDEIKQYRKQRRKMLISKLLGKFQQQTSKKINILRNTPGQKNWQPDYYDHIIRNQKSYKNIKNYIINNPQNWTEDKFNTENKGK